MRLHQLIGLGLALGVLAPSHRLLADEGFGDGPATPVVRTAPSASAPGAPPNATIGAGGEADNLAGDPGVAADVSGVGANQSLQANQIDGAMVAEPLGDVDAAGSAGPIAADFAPNPAAADPSTTVGRLARLAGTAALARDGSDEAPARPNQPIVSGDELTTGADGRLEIRLAEGSIWLGPGSRLSVLRLDQQGVVVRLLLGQLGLGRAAGASHVLQVEAGDGVSVRCERGLVFVTAPNSGSPTVRTASGAQASVRVGGEARTLSGGQELNDGAGVYRIRRATGASDSFANDVATAYAVGERGRAAAPMQETLRHVSPKMVGYEDLAGAGAWQSTPSYGPIWQPTTLPAGWAPYRFGHWEYVVPWGWTWVDSAPWGFAPFHYGRWIAWQGGWAWAPGTYWSTPIYAPALVAWSVGWGSSVAWYPLGWGQPWRPWYAVSAGYAQQVNRPYAPMAWGTRGRPGPFLPPTVGSVTQLPSSAFHGWATHGTTAQPVPLGGRPHFGQEPPTAPVPRHLPVANFGPQGSPVRGPVAAGGRVFGYGQGVARSPFPQPWASMPRALPAYRYEPRMPYGPSPARPLMPRGTWLGQPGPGHFGPHGAGGGMPPPGFGFSPHFGGSGFGGGHFGGGHFGGGHR